VFVVVLVILAALPGYFMDDSRAVGLLEKQGFSDIKLKSKDWLFVSVFGCGSDDNVKFTFDATNPVGKQVQVEVCVGWPFKGATLRN